MGMKRHLHLATALVLAASAAVAAQAELAQTSPFLPPGVTGSGAQGGGPSGPIELRGIMATSQGTAYCIYDVVKKTSTWVGLNEPGYDFTVKSADVPGESVMVDFRGSPVKLVLRTAKVASAGPAAAPRCGIQPAERSHQSHARRRAAQARRRGDRGAPPQARARKGGPGRAGRQREPPRPAG